MPVLFIISLLLHLLVAWLLLPPLQGWPLWQAAVAMLLAVSALLMPMGLLARRWRQHRLYHLLAWAGALLMGWFSSLFVGTVLREVALGLARLAAPLPAGLDNASALVVVGLATGVTLWGLWNARRLARVVRVEVPIAGLPPALQGFSIAQISDIHVGPTIGHGYLRRIVERVNHLGADLVAVTGDLVDGSVAELADHVQPLAGLRSRHGSFFVTGNHEYYSGVGPWLAELRRLGLRVLLNEHVLLRHDGATLVLAGVADYSAHHFEPSHRSSPQAALADAPADAGVRVLLAHQPRSAEAAAAAGFDLQLSGHTHGGQFWPWNHFVRLQQPYSHGLRRLKQLWIYISRGTGYWGPPKRLGAPSEITLLRLVAAR